MFYTAIYAPYKIFCNDEVTVTKAENLFKLSFHTVSVLFTMLDDIHRDERRNLSSSRD